MLHQVERWHSAECIPQKYDETESDDEAEDDAVAPLSQVDLLHQVVDGRELVGEVVELGLDGLEHEPLVDEGLAGLDGDVDLVVYHPLRVARALALAEQQVHPGFPAAAGAAGHAAAEVADVSMGCRKVAKLN